MDFPYSPHTLAPCQSFVTLPHSPHQELFHTPPALPNTIPTVTTAESAPPRAWSLLPLCLTPPHRAFMCAVCLSLALSFCPCSLLHLQSLPWYWRHLVSGNTRTPSPSPQPAAAPLLFPPQELSELPPLPFLTFRSHSRLHACTGLPSPP